MDEERAHDRERSRPRDAQVAGRVGRWSFGLSVIYAVAGVVVGGLIGTLIWGFASGPMWILTAVGGVVGAVLGGMQGGIAGAMDEASKEPEPPVDDA